MFPLRSFPGYAELTPVEKRGICNGAGAKGVWYSRFIPNTLYGLDCTEAFNRHDHGYWAGRTQTDKLGVDLDMLVNMALLIIEGSKWLALPRMLRAAKYFLAVYFKGHDAYWSNKPHFRRNN